MTKIETPAVRKVQPLLIPAALSRALEAAIQSMRSPMMPTVTVTMAARELLTLGCDALEIEIRSGAPVVWTVEGPPRGPRRREEHAVPRATRVRDEVFAQLSPIALPEPLIARLHRLQGRLAKVCRARVSFAKMLREALARGCVERERVRKKSADFVREHADLLERAGFPDPTRLQVVGMAVTQPFRRASAGARASGASKASGRLAPTPPQAAAEPMVPSRPRARTGRRRSVPRRAVAGGGDSDDGEGASPRRATPGRHVSHSAGCPRPSRGAP